MLLKRSSNTTQKIIGIKNTPYRQQKLLEREEMLKLDKMIEQLKRNKKKYLLVVIMIAITFNSTTLIAFANGASLDSINKAGMTILELVREVGYWVCIIMGAKDIITNAMRGHIDRIGTVITMYALAFGALFFLPWIFDIIKSIFN